MKSVDETTAARKKSLADVLAIKYGVQDSVLVDAIVALGEGMASLFEDLMEYQLLTVFLLSATAHIAVHLQNYVEHTYAGSQNASGDEQLHLDIQCDQDVFNACRESNAFAVVASEETPKETVIGEGKFSLGCDPLDGSSVIDSNFSVGSIFGIWPGKTLVGRTGREQIASAVAIYGSRTLLLIALAGQKPFEVTLIKDRSKWEISRDAVSVQPVGKVFAPGNLRATSDNVKYQKLVQNWIENRYTLRYTGGMVPDIYHIFAKGKGVFTNVSSPSAKAKLRLLYEVAPMGLIMECAGGVAICEDKDMSVLDVKIEDVDQRLGICFGSTDEAAKFREIMY